MEVGEELGEEVGEEGVVLLDVEEVAEEEDATPMNILS